MKTFATVMQKVVESDKVQQLKGQALSKIKDVA